MTPPEISIRDLHASDDYAAVVDLQRRIWGRDDDNIPAWMLAASMERGAVLIGADDAAVRALAERGAACVYRLRCDTPAEVVAEARLPGLAEAIRHARPGLVLLAHGVLGAELAPRPGATEEKVLRALVEAGAGVRSFTPARISLDEIFIKVYGEQHELTEG